MNKKPIVLLYHEIAEKPSVILNYYNITIHPLVFKKHVKWISEKYSIVPADCISEDVDLKNCIILSFDDGYSNALRYFHEICKTKAFWFLNKNFMDNEKIFWLSKLFMLKDLGLFKYNGDLDYFGKMNYSNKLLFSIDTLFKEYAINELEIAKKEALYAKIEDYSGDLCLLGDHTKNHCNCFNITKSELLTELNSELDYFAIPFGIYGYHWNENTIKAINKIHNYKYIFSVGRTKEVDKVIPRLQVPVDITEKEELINIIELFKRNNNL